MQESIELVMYYIQDETGLWINDFTVYFFLNRENFLDVFLDETGRPESARAEYRRWILERGDNWASVDYTRTSGAGVDIFLYGKSWLEYESWSDESWIGYNERLLGIMAHEYFHVLQDHGLSAAEAGTGSHDVVYKTGPAWLGEGSAEYVSGRIRTHELLLEYGYPSFAEYQVWLADRARETAAPLQSTETYNGLAAADGVGYELGFMAVDFLVDNFGDLPALPALVSFYDAIGPGTTWYTAFRSTFGISIDEFYVEFEAYRRETFPPLPEADR